MSKAHSRSWFQTIQDRLPSWAKWKTDPNQTVSDGEIHFNIILLRHRRPTSALTVPPAYRDTKGNKNHCNNAVVLESDEEFYDSHDEIEGVYQSTPVVESKPQRVIRTAQNDPKAIHDTVASQCLCYSLCAKFRVVFKIPKVPNSLSVQISGSFINEAWYHFWPNI